MRSLSVVYLDVCLVENSNSNNAASSQKVVEFQTHQA